MPCIKYVFNISKSSLKIHDAIDVNDSNHWIPTSELEQLLNEKLVGLSLKGMPLRTRSKFVKEEVCKALGYPVPKSFKKTKPRFLGQQFDTYIQKSNNLQIWNEEVCSSRRYVIIRVSEQYKIISIKVITGETLAKLDKTGTLTQKYQARIDVGEDKTELITPNDTDNLTPLLIEKDYYQVSTLLPTDFPTNDNLMPMKEIFEKLKKLVGITFPDAGYDQERNRGAILHKKVCEHLGYISYQDSGQFPDIFNQLLEIKLQTSPTIDLGLVCPDSKDVLDMPLIEGRKIRHCDVRYAIFYAKTNGENVTITNFYLTTGEEFFKRFVQFQGKVLNRKLQIPLSKKLFNS